MSVDNIISLVGIILNGVVAVLVAMLNRNQTLSLRKMDDVAKKVEEVHIETNSMKDALVKATQIKAFAEGRTEERQNPSQP